MPKMPNTIGKRIRHYRRVCGMSLADLAERIGNAVTRQMLWKYEQGKSLPPQRIVAQIASALGVKVIALYEEPRIRVEFIEHRKPHQRWMRNLIW